MQFREFVLGRNRNIITSLAALSTALCLLLLAGASLSAQAKARTPAGQTQPAVRLISLEARDAETFQSDKTLEASCRKSGQNKSICLCVTYILKYEMTLSEYEVVTRLYGQTQNRQTLHQSLKNEGFKPSEIGKAEAIEKALTQAVDFDARCLAAKSYYKDS